jgi:hypothetical protein
MRLGASKTACVSLVTCHPPHTHTHTDRPLFRYNANSAPSTPLLRVPVRLDASFTSWAVLGPDGTTPLPAQLIPDSPRDAYLRTTYYSAPAANMSWLAFFPPLLPAVGFTTVFLTPVAMAADAPATSISVVQSVPQGTPVALSLGNVTLGFDSSGRLTNYSLKGGPATQLQHDFLYYPSSLGDQAATQVGST